jgi:uncharacterized protein (TIGR00251 family)
VRILFHKLHQAYYGGKGEQMKTMTTKDGVVLEAHVKPRSKIFSVQVGDELVILCRNPPFEGKVNRELVKELSKIFKREVNIISGSHSRIKRILIRDIAEAEVLKALELKRKHNSV